MADAMQPCAGGALVDDSLAAPFHRIDAETACSLVRVHWGRDVTDVHRLATERDDTFRVSDGVDTFVLKVAHPRDDPAAIDLQCQALVHAGSADPSLPLPQLVPSSDGRNIVAVQGAAGETRLARMLSYLPGQGLDYAETDPVQRRLIGETHGRLSAALSRFAHAGASRYLHFDLKQLGSLRGLLPCVENPDVRRDVTLVLDRFDSSVGAALSQTRQQVVHHDLNADNLLVDPRTPGFVTGILDFGDVVHSSLVGDLAVAMCYAVDAGDTDGRTGDPWAGPYDLATGFEEVVPLRVEERSLLPDLVMARLAQRMLLNSWLAQSDPANAAYTGRTIARSGVDLRRLLSAPSR